MEERGRFSRYQEASRPEYHMPYSFPVLGRRSQCLLHPARDPIFSRSDLVQSTHIPIGIGNAHIEVEPASVNGETQAWV